MRFHKDIDHYVYIRNIYTMSHAPFPILSISGYEKAGKDTLARMLVPHGFEHLHNIWWIKDATREALRGHVPDHQLEGYVGDDHVLKEIPLDFPPFNDSGTALSTRWWQIGEVEKTTLESRFEANLHGKFLHRASPLAITGMRMTAALSHWREQATALSLPIRFVWVVNPEQGELAKYDSMHDMYPGLDFWDAVVMNPRHDPAWMLTSLRMQLPEVDAAIRGR